MLRVDPMIHLQTELEALQYNLRALPIGSVSHKSVVALARLMTSGMTKSNKTCRINMLQIMIGPVLEKPIKSTKQLPGSFANFIIDLLKQPNKGEETIWELSEYGQRFLAQLETRAKTQVTP